MAVSPLVAATALVAGVRAVGAVSKLADTTFQRLLQIGENLSATGANKPPADDSSGSDAPAASASVNPIDAYPEIFTAQSLARVSLDRFHQLARQRLAAGGIDTSIPIELETDSHGRIQLRNEHPQRRQIESLLDGDMELKEMFQQVKHAYLTHASSNIGKTTTNRSQQMVAPGRSRFSQRQVTGSESPFTLQLADGAIKVVFSS